MFIILGLLMLLVTTNPFLAALEPKEKKKFHVLLVVVLFLFAAHIGMCVYVQKKTTITTWIVPSC
jgi:fucose permease